MNTKNIKYIILCGVIFLSVFFGIVCFWSFEKTYSPNHVVQIIKPENNKIEDLNEKAEIIIKDLILKEIEKHKGLAVIVNAREGKILNSTDKIECKNITCALSDNDNQIADLKSDNALIHKSTKNVLLSGPASGHFYDISINGQDINYNYLNQTLTTNKKIQYQHKYFSMSTNKSLVDLKYNKITMLDGVVCTILNGSASHGNTN